MASLLKIGVDIDGVLANTDDMAYLKYCENELGWRVNYSEFKKSHSWKKTTEKTSLEMAEAFRSFISTDKQKQKLVPGAFNALSILSAIAEIYIITARRDVLREATDHFIKNKLKGINGINLSMNNHENKSTRLDECKLDFFIDDSHTEITKILENDNLKTKIIPFPTFHVQPNWSNIKINKRVIWLKAWQEVTINIDKNRQAIIQQKAWEEISQRICP